MKKVTLVKPQKHLATDKRVIAYGDNKNCGNNSGCGGNTNCGFNW